MKDFLSDCELPPYLRAIDDIKEDVCGRSADNATQGSSENGEADVAGGSVLQRVSSFNLLRPAQSPRPQVEKAKEKIQSQPPTEVYPEIIPTRRLKDRTKTVGVGLVMALNVGTEPPDITKPHPCAMLQCWMDPSSISRAKAKEKIGERLESQYAQWQLKRGARPMRYRRALDPTVEEVRALCLGLRRQARNERILLHYNGHGVPRPTVNGEIWVFDKNHTQYIPLSITDLRQWIGKPSIVVLDCSSAGILMPFLTAPLESNDATPPQTPNPTAFGDEMETTASQWIRDTIVLSPTSENEWLPMHPDYPADIFTSCLTTPIKMALRWFVRRNPQSMGSLNPDVVDAIPGKATDRKTPLGDLNWIFTSVTDSIAWNILPKPLFQRLFRQDLMVASLFRNFLLADRILRSLNCSPQSFPPFPPGVCDHPLWQAWDLACETCLCRLIKDGILSNQVLLTTQPDPENDGDEDSALNDSKPDVAQQPIAAGPSSCITSPFFSEQLTAFEIWLEFASIRKANRRNEPMDCPEQLPVVLQLLLSQAHRERALTLLSQFLDLGPWAVSVALSVGIFPYVMKLWLSQERKQYLVGIWARIISFDSSCQVELVKDGALPHFVQHLTWGLNRATLNLPLNPVEASEQRILAAFILSAICVEYPQGQLACIRLNLHGTSCALLTSAELSQDSSLDPDYQKKVALAEARVPPVFRMWLCLCLGNLFDGNVTSQTDGLASGVHLRLFSRLQDDSPDVRAAACFAIACLLRPPPVPEANPMLPSVPLVAPSQTTLNSVTLSSASSQGNRLYPQQPMIPPQTPTAEREFPGRLQPSFVNPQRGAPAWHPHQLPSNILHNPTQDVGQALRAQSYQYEQNVPSSPLTGPDTIRESLSQGRSQTNSVSRQRIQQPHGEPSSTNLFSMFEDRRRLALDLLLAKTTLAALNDANPMVRCEGVFVISIMLCKYLPVFLSASEEMTLSDGIHRGEMRLPGGGDDGPDTMQFPFPTNIDDEAAENFRLIWRSLNTTREVDAHPVVRRAANAIVRFVQERLFRKEVKALRGRLDGSRSRSDHDIQRFLSNVRSPSKAEEPLHHSSSKQDYGFIGSMVHPMSMTSFTTAQLEPMAPKDIVKPESTLPKSGFFQWKRDDFFSNKRTGLHFDSMDQLSPRGALRAYLGSRNAAAKGICAKIAQYYSCLAPKPMTTTTETLNKDFFFEIDESATHLAEEKLTRKKKTLELKQTGLLTNKNALSTSMLCFHPYEDILLVCDDRSVMSVWDTKGLTTGFSIRNGNPKGSRFTSTCWMNADSNSVFIAGCDDGSVRAWGGIPFLGSQANTSATLLSAFYALPQLLPDKSKSGLILDWQQFTGNLFAAGNFDRIRRWDMNVEKCSHELKTDSHACVTTLTTAWRSDVVEDGRTAGNSYCTGPNILVAGFSDGVVKVFDTRTQSAVVDAAAALPGSGRNRRQRATTYKEHGSWVVETAFIGYGNSYGVRKIECTVVGFYHLLTHIQIVSGSVVGDVRIFDLRSSRSLQNYTVQRSPMTAMAVHPQIPLIASGSHAQFIKLMTLDGESIQVIRHSQLNHGRMIGPISCLAFHPQHTLLAAGGTDNLVHLFSPKIPLDLDR